MGDQVSALRAQAMTPSPIPPACAKCKGTRHIGGQRCTACTDADDELGVDVTGNPAVVLAALTGTPVDLVAAAFCDERVPLFPGVRFHVKHELHPACRRERAELAAPEHVGVGAEATRTRAHTPPRGARVGGGQSLRSLSGDARGRRGRFERPRRVGLSGGSRPCARGPRAIRGAGDRGPRGARRSGRPGRALGPAR